MTDVSLLVKCGGVGMGKGLFFFLIRHFGLGTSASCRA